MKREKYLDKVRLNRYNQSFVLLDAIMVFEVKEKVS